MRETCYVQLAKPLKVMIGLGALLEFKDGLRPMSDWRKRREGNTFLLCDGLQYPDAVDGE